MGSQYEGEKVGRILAQEELNGLHLLQFECTRHWKPPVSSNFEVGRLAINLGNLARAGALGYWRVLAEYSKGVSRRDSPAVIALLSRSILSEVYFCEIGNLSFVRLG